MNGSHWYVYLIRTRYHALYCGATNNLAQRFSMHEAGKGARALKGKGPLSLEWSIKVKDKSSALKLEYRIKQLKKDQKEKLIHGEAITEFIAQDIMKLITIA